MAFHGTKEIIIRRVTLCLIYISIFLIIIMFHMDTTTEWDDIKENNFTFSVNPFNTFQNTSGQEEAFAFIPAATVSKWAQTEFLIVFGIPSLDNDGRRRRRALQRATCWTFPGVATRANGHSGSLLVLYALARHPAHGFALSESLRLETAQWHDIINLPMNEGRVTTNKIIGRRGCWGHEAGIGMSKKTFFWLQLALRAFPLAIHLDKGDDDMFMNVPQYLADLRLLPRRGTYWGAYARTIGLKNKKMEHVDVKFMVGFCVAFARDVSEAIVTYETLRQIVSLPYSKETELDFLILNVNCEDIMVGRVLKESGYLSIFVVEKLGCRFHNSDKRKGYRSVSEPSVVVHHFEGNDYYSFMRYFIKNSVIIQNTTMDRISPTFYRVRCPMKKWFFFNDLDICSQRVQEIESA